MLISQYEVFDCPDSAKQPSIFWTILDPTTDWNDDTLKYLAPGSIIVQVTSVGDNNCGDCEIVEIFIKLYPTPDTEGYDAAGDYRPILHQGFIKVAAPVSSDEAEKRAPIGSWLFRDSADAGNIDYAFVKVADTGSEVGGSDWHNVPIVNEDGGISLGGTNAGATGQDSAHVGGESIAVTADRAVAVGGSGHEVYALNAVAVGGRDALIDGVGLDGVSIGGRYNDVDGIAGIAIGHKVDIDHNYAILLNAANGGSAYDTEANKFVSTAANEIAMRASGGYRMYTNDGQSAGVTMAAGASSWSAVSDARTKELIAEVSKDTLAGYRRLRIWEYVQGDDSVGAGITAQDYYDCFPFAHQHMVGESLAISQAERDGIQDLAIKQVLATVDHLIDENTMLRRRIARLEKHLNVNQ